MPKFVGSTGDKAPADLRNYAQQGTVDQTHPALNDAMPPNRKFPLTGGKKPEAFDLQPNTVAQG